jgi:hypothetical protein
MRTWYEIEVDDGQGGPWTVIRRGVASDDKGVETQGETEETARKRVADLREEDAARGVARGVRAVRYTAEVLEG